MASLHIDDVSGFDERLAADQTGSSALEFLRQVPPIDRYMRIVAAGGTAAEAHAIMLRCMGANDPAFYIAPSRISQIARRVAR